MRSYWQRQGFKDVNVRHERTAGDPLVITMKVDRGLYHVIQAVRFTGNTQMAEPAARETVGVQPGTPYDEARVAAGIARLRQTYLQLGYYRVQVTEGDVEEVTAAQTAAAVPVIVPIRVAEGLQGRIARLSFSGLSSQREAEIRRLPLTSKEGEYYVRENLTRDRQQIETYFRNQGFESAIVQPPPLPAGDSSSIEIGRAHV